MRGAVRRIAIFFSVILVSAVLVSWPRAAEPLAKPAADAPPAASTKKSKPKITVSKETTYVLGPLREDGTVDFTAALNELTGKGVKPENNAAVPFWQAMGPKEIPEKVRPQFFKLLGVPPLPDNGDYFVSLGHFAKSPHTNKQSATERNQQLQSERLLWVQDDQASSRPWSKKEFPQLAKWLEAVDKPLKLIAEGTSRARFFSPVCQAERSDTLQCKPAISMFQFDRDVARALGIRAMLRVESGQVDAAFQDALACHRLGRLVGQGPFTIDRLVGLTVDEMASSADARIAEYAHVTTEQAIKFQGELRKLPAFNVGIISGYAERLYVLDSICITADDVPDMIKHLGNGMMSPPSDRSIIDQVARHGVDLDEVLRRINQRFEDTSQALSKPKYANRVQAIAQVSKEINASWQVAEKKDNTVEMSKVELSDRVADLIADLRLGTDAQLLVRLHLRQVARVELAETAYAIVAFRDEHGGKYPAKLAELVLKYAAVVPTDPFTDGQEFRYKPNEKGYLLYSVGENGKDEGGREPWDKPSGDDVTLHMPHKADDDR